MRTFSTTEAVAHVEVGASSDLSAEALIEEARQRQRRRWRRGLIAAVLVVALAFGIGFGDLGGPRSPRAQSRGGGPGSVVWSETDHGRAAALTLPDRLSYSTIAAGNGYLQLYGPTQFATGGTECATARLALSRSVLYDVDEVACADSGLTLTPTDVNETVPVVASTRTWKGVPLRVARIMSTGRTSYGPVLFRFDEGSDNWPQWLSADGWLWIFESSPNDGGPEVFQVSDSTGALVDTIRLPGTMSRPTLAADDDGLWLGFGTEGGTSLFEKRNETPIFHIAPGASSAKLVLESAGRATGWMVAEGHHVWVVAGIPGLESQRLWRLDGPDARVGLDVTERPPRGLPSNVLPVVDADVIGGEQSGLWTAVAPFLSNAEVDESGSTTRQYVLRVDPNTGRARVVATLHPPVADASNPPLAAGEAVIYRGYFYLLDSSNGTSSQGSTPAVLYRIKLS
jgi:hypothetical protein